ncbi:MAG: hypothetical protein K2Z25_22365 [Beijerinckiaceae bacterium]|nr:hypothetical protein [Beijerinckiaceae bacterium]
MTDIPHVPPVPDIVRAEGKSAVEVAEYYVDYFNRMPANFNYVRGTRVVKDAYRGLHNLSALVAGCSAEKNLRGRAANIELVTAVAPFAFGRKTQVFDLPKRKFPFGRERLSGYRVPFFFVEDGIVKLYFVQSRKRMPMNEEQLAMYVTIVKRYLLDVEFFGLPADVEVIEASAPDDKKHREPERFRVADFLLWSDEALARRLTIISEGLDLAASSGRIVDRPRRQPQAAPDMPLFD